MDLGLCGVDLDLRYKLEVCWPREEARSPGEKGAVCLGEHLHKYGPRSHRGWHETGQAPQSICARQCSRSPDTARKAGR